MIHNLKSIITKYDLNKLSHFVITFFEKKDVKIKKYQEFRKKAKGIQ